MSLSRGYLVKICQIAQDKNAGAKVLYVVILVLICK